MFFLRYPYCYGYWKKYADIEKKHGNIQAAEEVKAFLCVNDSIFSKSIFKQNQIFACHIYLHISLNLIFGHLNAVVFCFAETPFFPHLFTLFCIQ